MGSSGHRKPPLVAPKRARAGKTGAARKRAPRKPPRRGRSRNPLLRLLRAVFGFFARVLWAVGWRATLALTLVIGTAVAYTYTTLPEHEALMDGRARGRSRCWTATARSLPGAGTSSAAS